MATSESRLRDVGLEPHWLELARSAGLSEGELARVGAEHRHGLTLVTNAGDVAAKLAGRLCREIAQARAPRPVVGDWVLLRPAGSAVAQGPRVIERVLARRSHIGRRAPGRAGGEQVVVANVDVALLVCALGPDVNEHRLQRLAALAHDGGVEPVVVLNKCDTCSEWAAFAERAHAALPGAAVAVVSAKEGTGLDQLDPYLEPSQTLAVLGSSGVGKSTLVNRWLGGACQSTGPLTAEGKGRHTTTRRQLFTLPTGTVVVDTPGLREVGLWASEEGLARVFEDVAEIAAQCRFRDCRHEQEPGCAVRAAVAAGTLATARAEAWRAFRRELRESGPLSDRAARRRRR